MDNTKTILVPAEELEKQNSFAQKVKKLLGERYPEHIPLAHVHSYGCQQNSSDGEKIKGMLAVMGYGFTDCSDNAQLVIYNTCAIRENAEDKVFGNIGELKHNKERDPNMIVGLCGCMMQQPHIVEKLRKSYPQVDLIFGTHVVHELPENLYKTLIQNKRVFDTADSEGIIAEKLPIVRDSKFKAGVPIMYGCNNFCTYCIVPYVRGRERSREPKMILSEIRTLIADGCKEITLLGQNVNSYGRGLKNEISFSQLLRQINDLDGDFRIRFMTSHPKDATHELIDTIASCDKVCAHIHLPIQSGSNRILSLMNRHYSREQYIELAEYAKKTIPNLVLTSDIIVGFPTETEDDFEDTLSLIREIKYDSLFTFIYSKRVGTKAAEMLDKATEKQKGERFTRLLAVQKELSKGRYDYLIGKTLRVLADGVSKTADGYITGRTDNFIIVDFAADKEVIGNFVDVKITKSLNWALIGEMI